ncbi:aldehyde dehydrogenase family 3 member H1-like isoform X2 [Zingiber officinale]|uniref:aldehyde dehydrogenase family 3 member H1-like isoform X2 n=1 Tax=Zingiber officinale TaxID=94328 RepID=UPI001C4CAACC|nr:aldehyde dehydrogenase family 3 member H1-like isoform X2 [Zingiber officinale]XP_042411518.1 aldehyde dehydrogenase family 3 member H1-like isoform X2 [Zingiber officinale]
MKEGSETKLGEDYKGGSAHIDGGEKMEGGAFDGARAAELTAELRRSFDSGRTRSYEWRAAQLKGIARMIEEKEADIMAALHDDLAKPQMESFLHEISLAKASCTFALKELKRWMKPEKVPASITTFPSSAVILPEPLGIALIISAWNYPFLLSIDPVIGAIAAGNAVALKPSEVSPATSSLFAKVLPTYVDNSCIKVVEGSISETTVLLEQKWDKIFYTGSKNVGRIVMVAAAKHLTPVTLELGGKSPVIVDSNVNIKVTAKRIAVGKWGSNNGQACIAPDYILTTKAFAKTLVDALKITLDKFYGKDPLESADLSRVVNDKHFSRLTNLLNDQNVSGTIIYGGQWDEKRLKIAPTLLLDVPHDTMMMDEEIFGPLLPIITFEKIEQCFDFIQSKEKPLAAYLFTKDKKLEEKFVQTVSAGGILINDTGLHFANPHLPFGGVGESGIGAYHGKFSFDTFSHKKAVLSRSFAGEASARYPPYTQQKQKILRGLINGSFIALLLALIGWPRD